MEIALTAQIVIIAVAAIVAQWTAWRFHIPAIVFLLGFGFVLGPGLDVLQPDLLMGDLLRPAIAASVAIILFEGSLQLRFSELRSAQRALWHVILIGAPLGWFLLATAAHYIAGLSWATSITLGGMLIVTGPTVIIPMLRQARLLPRVGAILKWEGIINDPIGIILAVLSFEYFVSQSKGADMTVFAVENASAIVMISLASFLAAHAIKYIFERGHVPEYLKAPFLLTFVLLMFFGSNAFLHESGLISVTILGMTLTNIHHESLEEIKRFKETVTLLLISGVFLLLTADLDVSVLLEIGWRDLAFVFALIFLLRPLTMFVCAIGTKLSLKETILIGWIAPRGVVCAAMAGIFGPLLVEAGFEDGAKLLPIAFLVVVLTVFFHGLSIKPVAKRLGLVTKENNGLLISGGHPWTIQLAETLKTREIPVMIVDTNWHVLSKARLANIPVHYGELLSEETEHSLEFNAYTTLLAAHYNKAYSALACYNFSHEFGQERVFYVNVEDKEVPESQQITQSILGEVWVDNAVTLSSMWERFNDGWRFKISRIGENPETNEMILPNVGDGIVAGYITKNNILRFYTGGKDNIYTPKVGDYCLTFSLDVPSGR